jgi:hypothetical protein
VPIEFEVADDLASWRAEIRVVASAEALSGPTSLPGKRVQVHNPAGSEVGPGTIATQGKATADQAEAFGFKWDLPGRSSKHMRQCERRAGMSQLLGYNFWRHPDCQRDCRRGLTQVVESDSWQTSLFKY